MIKLKSLFRRGGQGPSSGSGNKNSSSATAKNTAKTRSTTSLNSADSTQPQQQAAPPQPAAKFYANEIAGERAVDVGSEFVPLGSNSIQSARSVTPTPCANIAVVNTVNSNTLPLKSKTKAGATKRQKQPKQLPVPPTAASQQIAPATAGTTAAPNAHVMTTVAAAPGSINSAGSHNNNYHTHFAQNSVNAVAAAAALPPSTYAAPMQIPIDNVIVANDLFKLNSSASAANYNFNSDQHQQQQQQQQMQAASSKMQELQTQLERLGRENLQLESRIAELQPYQSEVGKLKNELLKMQSLQDKSQGEIANLKYENETLRNRLRDVVNSPLSDTEKHQIIQDSQRLHSSAPASIAIPSSSDAHDGTPCVTPDWDKHSSCSEISVACLQDKIIQMEETHYSTNEELQATLQELADLQTQLSETQTENERLSEEKDVLFQSLCRQTEKLNDSRTQITNLQDLLLRDAKQAEIGSSEREKKLLDLIQTSQEEREATMLKQEELNAELQEVRQSLDSGSQDNARFRERISLLDSTLDAANAERKQLDADLLRAREDASQKAIEINRLTTLLDNARAKIDELEQDMSRGEKTDLSEVLEAARKEKDALEERVAALQDQCSRSQAEIGKLRDQLGAVHEEVKVAKNNAKCAVSLLEYRCETLQQEKEKLSGDYQLLLDSKAELQVQCKCHLEDKAQLQSLLAETQQHVDDVQRKLNDKEEQLDKEIKLRKQEAEEWQQFQSDLLMTVRVANDFKTEALTAREQLVLDNKTQKEKIRLLEQQIEKLNKQQIQHTETQQSVLSSVQQEMATRRSKIGSLTKQDSRLSVKSLIETIENNKQSKTEDPESHYSSSSSLNSGTPETISPNILPATTNIPNEWTENVRIPVSNSVVNTSSLLSKGPLREQQQQQTIVSNIHFSSMNNVSKPLVSGERKDPLNMLAKNGGSKRNALLKWCQNKTVGYRNIDITNFSSSWNDGLAFCAILHSYLPDRIPYDTLSQANKRRNFSLAFAAAESVGITTTLNINDMCQLERPDWTQVMTYVTAIYKYFET